MVIMTAKIAKGKLLAAALVLLALIAVLLITISGCTGKGEEKLATNEQRIAYLRQLGWEVAEEPVKTQQIVVPDEMNDVLSKYNELQCKQGLDLSKHLGESAKRYVYQVTNYPDAEGEVYATLVISKDRLIAADLTCHGENGFVRSLQKEAP